MNEVSCYIFTPCCGGHPVIVNVNDVNGNPVIFNPPIPSEVWQYTPLAPVPYTDSFGNSLIPGKCYSTSTGKFPVGVVPCPGIVNWTYTETENCDDALDPINETGCNCDLFYELQPCCGGQSLIYNIPGSEGLIVNDSGYLTTLDPNDLTTSACYRFTLISDVENPELIPILDISNVDTSGTVECEASFLCNLICFPCVCQEFSNDPNIISFGEYNVVTCDLRGATITGTIDGPVIVYMDDPTEYPVSKICLKYWVEETPGLIRTEQGDCETVYWDQTGSQFDCPVNYKIVNCDPDSNEEYCVTNDLSIYFNTGQTFTLIVDQGDTPKCWYVDIAETCVNPITITAPSLTFDNCNDCLQTFVTVYKLTNCDDTAQSIYTDVNLEDYLGSLIKLQNYTGCWYVEVHTGLNPQLITVSVLPGTYETCPSCNLQSYLLEDCADIENDIITNTDLSAYVGSVITLKTCPDVCWKVYETELSPLATVYFKEEFVDCTECLINTQPAICVTFTNTSEFSTSFNYTDSLGNVNKTTMAGKQVIPKVCALSWDINPSVSVTEFGNCIDGVCPPTPTPKRKVTPGYNTPACTPDYYENVECHFSEWMYKDVLQKRYGITNCCPDELMKWEIKHEILMLESLTNPDYNCPVTTSCCDPAPTSCTSCGCSTCNC